MKKYSLILIGVSIIFVVNACGEGTDVVESGTYTGTIAELNAEETEIYVETENNQRLELYFTDSTTLTRNGETVPFSTLEQGDRVEVTVEKVGQRLEPKSVKLLE
jgi:2-keto-4-pentenoate hydratase/2-oxohepta-3-ene-1,7-dioic acid hydratase in catechol pathway